MENRQSRVLIVLSVVLTLLVLAIVFVEPPGPDPEEGRTWTRAFPDVAEDAVTAVRVSMAGREVLIEKVDGKWMWTAPVQAPADATQVDSLVSSMLFVDVGPALPELAPAGVGLDASATRVELQVGAESLSLSVGEDAPVGSSTYVQVGDGPVQASRTRTSAAMPPRLDALRSRSLVVYPRSEVTELVVQSPDGERPPLHILRTDDGDWLADATPRLRADRTQVDTLVDALRYAEAESFLDEAGPLTDAWVVTVSHSQPSQTTELRLAEGMDGVWRASGPVQPGQGVLAASELPELLARPPSAWVDPHLLTLRHTTLDRLEVVLDGRSMDARRTADGWDDPRAEAVLVAIETGSAQRGAPLPSPSGGETGVIIAHHGEVATELRLFQGLGDGGRAAKESGTEAPVAVSRGSLKALADALASGD